MSDTSLQYRLRAAVGRRTNREIGDMTGTHPETVRRYLHGQTPRVEFLAAFCEGLQINGDWLLTGRGRMHRTELRSQERRANATEQLREASAALERLIARVERMETMLKALESPTGSHRGSNGVSSGHAPSPAVIVPRRVQQLADAAARRRRADAR